MKLEPLVDKPIIHVSDGDLGGNVNGPSLIRVPDWVERPLGRYYLYFAHHEGDTIRLAYADSLTGPWTIYAPGALHLRDSHFPTEPPSEADLHPIARGYIERGEDGLYPHIASPDAVIDYANRTIRLYYHGRCADGLQLTRLATSTDGVNFTAHEPLLGLPYMRVFQHDGAWFGIGMPATLYYSADGKTDFRELHRLTPDPIRHHALLVQGDTLTVFWTRVGDAPERILVSEVDLSHEIGQWHFTNTTELHRPQRAWEGAHHPVEPSRYASIMHPVNQLRDPAVYIEEAAIYLLYAVAGEQGIGIGRFLE